MSTLRDPSPPASAFRLASAFGVLLRVGVRVLLLAIILFCSTLLVLRHVLLPDIDSYRERITRLLENQIGQPVEIGRLAAGWDGWNPRLDITELHVVDGKSHALDVHGTPLPDNVLAQARDADAILLGAVGGPKWDDPRADRRPEQALLTLRKELGLFANVRPVKAFK